MASLSSGASGAGWQGLGLTLGTPQAGREALAAPLPDRGAGKRGPMFSPPPQAYRATGESAPAPEPSFPPLQREVTS